ncbi:hypothetical protein ACXR2W_12550 [Leucobacter sp. HY1908]
MSTVTSFNRGVRLACGVLAGAAMITVGGGFGPAMATPASAFAIAVSPAVAQGAHDDALQLSWDGKTYTSTTTASFLGSPVTVPGDTAERTLYVRNSGPTAATFTADIVNVKLRTPEALDVHHNESHEAPDTSGLYTGAGAQGDFYDDLTIGWITGKASMTSLDAAGTTQIMAGPIAVGEVVPITLSYDFPAAATSGNKANVDPRLAEFDVRITLQGDEEGETPPPPEKPPVTTPPKVDPPKEVPPELTRTGAEVPPWGIALGLTGLGAVALAVTAGARKRRARSQG